MKKILLSMFLLLTLFGVNAQNIPSDGLVAWWLFTGNASDSSGNGNNGTVNGATLTTDRFGNSNRAYSFNGTNSNIRIAHNSSLNFQTQNKFTFSYWINASSLSSSKLSLILSKQSGSGSTQNGFNSSIEVGFQSNFRIQNGSPNPAYSLYTSNNSIATNRWYHIVQVWTGSKGLIYINGTLVSQNNGTSKVGDNTQDLLIGQPNWSGFNVKNFSGKIDDIGIWNRELNECEIKKIYLSKNILQKILKIDSDTLKSCKKDSVEITASSGFKSYQWSNNDTGRSIFIKESRKISVIATDSFGCKAYDTAIVSILNPKITPRDTIVCEKSLVLFRKLPNKQTMPVKITWFNSDTSSTTQFNSYKDTTVWLEVSDGIGTCYDTTKVFVSKPQLNVLNDTLKFKGCNRDSLRISVGSTWTSSQWNNNIKDSSIYLKTSGKYKVIVKDQYGCSATDSTYFVNPGRVKINTLLADSVSCFAGNNGDIKSSYTGGFTPYKFLWNDATKQITANATSLKKGSYQLVISDAYNCKDSLTANVYEPVKLVVKEPMSQTININQQAQFTLSANDNLATYQWQSDLGTGFQNLSNAGQYLGAQNDTLTVSSVSKPNNNQNFRCIVKSGPCLDTSNLAVLKVFDNVGLENLNIETIKVYPLPSSTQVIIDNGNYSTMGSYTAKIVNALGQQVFQSLINQPQFVIDAKSMGGAGVYTLYITDANNKVVGVKKIVLQ